MERSCDVNNKDEDKGNKLKINKIKHYAPDKETGSAVVFISIVFVIPVLGLPEFDEALDQVTPTPFQATSASVR
jgi:hypothetical protein